MVPKDVQKVPGVPWWSWFPTKILENHISNKGFVPGVHKRQSQLNNKKINYEDSNRHFSKNLQTAKST